jgi:hypothetical protein
VIRLVGSPVGLDEVGEFGTYGEDEIHKRKPFFRTVYRLAVADQSVVLVQLVFNRYWKDGKGALDGLGIILEQKRCSVF